MGTHDVFVCFSSKDAAVARYVTGFLEDRQHTCWLASRDVRPGHNFQEAIVEAIQNAKTMVFLFSEFSNRSAEIRKELALAGACGVIVFPLRLSEIAPSGALRYELATRQWIDAFPDFQQALDRLASAVGQALQLSAPRDETAASNWPHAVSVKRTEAQTPQTQAAGVPPTRPVIAADSKEIEIIRGLLARSVGPIAKVFIDKASADARSLDDLCERLASHIRGPDDRTAFLKATRGVCAKSR